MSLGNPVLYKKTPLGNFPRTRVFFFFVSFSYLLSFSFSSFHFFFSFSSSSPPILELVHSFSLVPLPIYRTPFYPPVDISATFFLSDKPLSIVIQEYTCAHIFIETRRKLLELLGIPSLKAMDPLPRVVRTPNTDSNRSPGSSRSAPQPAPILPSQELEHAYWAEYEEDTTVPDDDEMKEIEGGGSDYSASDRRCQP